MIPPGAGSSTTEIESHTPKNKDAACDRHERSSAEVLTTCRRIDGLGREYGRVVIVFFIVFFLGVPRSISVSRRKHR